MRRILSIDGGGIRGVFPAAFLAEIENDLDCPIGQYFDLIVGTSTGGIIAIGLALGMTAKEILQMYEDKGPEIFGQGESWIPAWIRRKYSKLRWFGIGPKYTTKALESAVGKILGNQRIGDAKTRLMIPSWDGHQNKVYIYKTAHHERLATDYKGRAIDAAMATAAAPTYFREHITANDVGLVDGGLWANNPVGIAVAEAIGVLGWPADELNVLSISCLQDVFEMKSAYSALSISKKISDFFMAGQSHGSLGLAHILTGDPHQRKAIYRVCQPVPDGFFELDDTSRIQNLKGRGFAEAREQKPILTPIFFKDTAELFTPIYKL